MWYRVFGRSMETPSPSKLVEEILSYGVAVVPHFKGDDLGWTHGELNLERGSPVLIDRYLTKEDDLRDDLNAFAAELETLDYNTNNTMLMERVIQSQQMITLRKPADNPDEVLMETLLVNACQFLAKHCDGIYQIDGQGWYAADGTLLLQEY